MARYHGTKAARTVQQEKEEEGKERQEIGKERRWKEKEEVTERTPFNDFTNFCTEAVHCNVTMKLV